MATATAPVEEKVEEVQEAQTETKRGRRKGQKLFNHDKIHPTKESCEENEPYYANEITKKETKDGKEVETTSYEGSFEAEGFRIYAIADMRLKDSDPKRIVGYCWARSGDGALSCWAGQLMEAELVDEKPRGRARKIDPIYLMFFESMINQKQVPQLLATLKEKELTHYLPLLGLDLEGNQVPKVAA